jgi:hypothetical protein
METSDASKEEEFKVNLEPFKASAVATWVVDNQYDPEIGLRTDFLISSELPEQAPEPPSNSARALMDLGATYKTKSMWNPRWNNPRLDSTTGAHLSKNDMNDEKNFWIEADFVSPAEVYQVILKRRNDADNSTVLQRRVNTHIKVQYQDPESKKWIYYKDGALLPTYETEKTPA